VTPPIEGNYHEATGDPSPAPEPDIELAHRLAREHAACVKAEHEHRGQADYHGIEAERYARMAAALSAALNALAPTKVSVPAPSMHPLHEQQLRRPVEDFPQA
jgi:hypothetical protein